MRPFLPAGFGCALVLCAATAAGAPGGTTGTLAAKAELQARAPWLAHAELVHTSTVPIGGTRVVRFAETYSGVPVLGRRASVVVDARGKTRVVAPPDDPRARPVTAATAAVDAATAAATASRASGTPFAATTARLAWMPGPGGARLVWTFYAGGIPGTAYAPAVVIDATTGRRLLAFDAVWFDRAASVHEENPVSTPTLADVVLEGLAAGATTLENERVRVLNCIDNQRTERRFGLEMHVCDLEQIAVADADGNFPYLPDDTDYEDEHAEVAMFFHVTKVYDYLSSIGMPELEAKLPAVVNFRMAQGLWSGQLQQSVIADPNVPLEPLDNAFFTPSSPFFEGFWGVEEAGLWFGQGRSRDFSYDGDVVYHEFGHAMIDRTIGLVPFFILDEQGATAAPGAMNEGLADYFSSAISGDSRLGEYVSGGFGAPSIRDLDNEDACPANLVGESHADSTLFSGALWRVRDALEEAERVELDRAIMTALVAASSGWVGFEELAAQIGTAVEASPLGTEGSSLLRDELERRGVLPACRRIHEWDGAPIGGTSPTIEYALVAPGKAASPLFESAPYAPGIVQIHAPIDEGAAEIRVEWDHVDARRGGLSVGFGGSLTPYEPMLLARFGPEPITFRYENGLVSTAEVEVDAEPRGPGYRATIEVPDGATEVHFMVANRGEEDGYYTDLTVESRQPEPAGTGGAGGTSGFGGANSFGGSYGVGGSAGDPAASAAEGLDVRPAGGCGCRAPAGPPASGAAWLLAVALWASARRRARLR